MRSSALKHIRVVFSVLVLLLLSFLFIDFRGIVPEKSFSGTIPLKSINRNESRSRTSTEKTTRICFSADDLMNSYIFILWMFSVARSILPMPIPAAIARCSILAGSSPIIFAPAASRATQSVESRSDFMFDRSSFETPLGPLRIMTLYVMMRNGPRGVSKDDLSNMKSLLLSTDWVALDAAGAKMMGLEPARIEHLAIAAGMGIGKIDLATLNIHRIKM